MDAPVVREASYKLNLYPFLLFSNSSSSCKTVEWHIPHSEHVNFMFSSLYAVTADLFTVVIIPMAFSLYSLKRLRNPMIICLKFRAGDHVSGWYDVYEKHIFLLTSNRPLGVIIIRSGGLNGKDGGKTSTP